jgi:hypothetical protein
MKHVIKTVDQSGSTIWVLKDNPSIIHRDDGPAIIWDDGSEFWYSSGVNHREDGPSATYAGGTMHWHVFGTNYDFSGWCARLGKTSEDILALKLKYGITLI